MHSSNPARNFAGRLQVVQQIGKTVVSVFWSDSFIEDVEVSTFVSMVNNSIMTLSASNKLNSAEHYAPSMVAAWTSDSPHSVIK